MILVLGSDVGVDEIDAAIEQEGAAVVVGVGSTSR
jgi:hypothetical protein